jgi:hypothetical protein
MAPPIPVEDVAFPTSDLVHGPGVGRHLGSLEEPPGPQERIGDRAVQAGGVVV